MKHLDFTIDFETCGLTANAAPMMVAVVPWRRDAEEDPFVMDDTGEATEEQTAKWPEPFTGYVDLRTCVVDGFDFDPETIRWWADRNAAAKEAVTGELAEPIQDVLVGVLNYIRNAAKTLRLESICLWCQGMDVDIAILRNLCKKYDIDLEDTVPHTSFRDCRTVILEAALLEAERSMTGKSTRALGIALPLQIQTDPSLAYKLFDPLPSRYAAGSEAHDALYDAMRSSWYTWQALKSIKQ